MVQVGKELLGRVISGKGEPIDGKGEIFTVEKYPVEGKGIHPHDRKIITEPLSVGIKSIDSLITVGRGQRIGIFTGEGVGASTVIGMIARFNDADVNVIALIGKSTLEVKDFLEKELRPEGLKRSVVVVVTSEHSPFIRLRGAFAAHAIGEYFRDQGMAVNLLMDSLTGFAMAQREAGFEGGELPVATGYDSSVSMMFSKLFDRTGKSSSDGSMTGFYSVLVENDDMSGSVVDIARGTLEGHIVLDRKSANRGYYPAVNVLASISRCMKDVVDKKHLSAAYEFRKLLAAYFDAEELIKHGMYVCGKNTVIDRAMNMIHEINLFLEQDIFEQAHFTATKEKLVYMMSTN